MAANTSNLKWQQGNTKDPDGPTYSVEYAMSGRSSCKQCKNTLVQGAIRLGTWVKSRHFDGREVRWMHYDCFFAKPRKECYGTIDIVGFDALRWDDQVKLKQQFKEIVGEKGAETFREDGIFDLNYYKPVEQTRIKWIVKDRVRLSMSAEDRRAMLELNDVPLGGGDEMVTEKIADGVMYGVVPKCPECKGRLQKHTDGSYGCTGFTAWSKCAYKTMAVVREPWQFPPDMSTTDFDEWPVMLQKGTIGVLLNRWANETESAVAHIRQADTAAVEEVRAAKQEEINAVMAESGGRLPLRGMSFVLVGKLSMGPVKFTEMITDYGGKVFANANVKATACITTQAEVDSISAKIVASQSMDLPLVSEDYVHAVLMVGGAADVRIDDFKLVAPELAPAPSRGGKGGSSEVNPRNKNAVHKDYELRQNFHVYEEDGVLYDTLLNLTDINSGVNNYYILQLLRHDSRPVFNLFIKWGRVGTDIGGTVAKPYNNFDEAFDEMCARYQDKTGNDWNDRADFKKKPGKFFPIEIDYGGEESALREPPNTSSDKPCRLDAAVKRVMDSLFDTAQLQQALSDLHLDKARLPLGKLKSVNMNNGYKTLRDIERVLIEQPFNKNLRLIDLSNQFYTIVPHDFGTALPPTLVSLHTVREKLRMLEALASLESATRIFMQPSPVKKRLHPAEANYLKLRCGMTAVPASSPEFRVISQYAAASVGVDRSKNYSIEVEDVVKLTRTSEAERFVHAQGRSRRMLLWHGSRVSNYASILSSGLQIAPSDAPHSGFVYGKGVYFSDSAVFSAGFCGATPTHASGFLLLAEVALGDSAEYNTATYVEAEALRKRNKQSVKACGQFEPDAAQNITTDDDVIIPAGRFVRSRAIKTEGAANEYIVYSEDQVSLKYLVRVRFAFTAA